MPRRRLLTPAERAGLLRLPDTEDELIRYYTLADDDLSNIFKRRGEHNRLGYAVQLCYLRYPGFALTPENEPPDYLLAFIGGQLHIKADAWQQYAQRDTTQREHLVVLQASLGLSAFTVSDYRRLVCHLSELAQQTDRGIVLAEALIDMIRQQRIILPVLEVIERLSSEALIRGTRQLHKKLTASLADIHFVALDNLLTIKEGTKISWLVWLRQPLDFPRAKHVLTHLERLQVIQAIALPYSIGSGVHQNRLLKLAREGAQMTGQHLRDLESLRRYATLIAVVLETRATLTDEIVDLHERFMNTLFSKAKRNHAGNFLQSGKLINEKVHLFSRIGHALLDAKQSGSDPFAAIEEIIPWDKFTDSIAEADKLVQPESLVHTPDGLDRRYYELCVMSELKNSLRAGDVWIEGSRQFKDFDEYLLPQP